MKTDDLNNFYFFEFYDIEHNLLEFLNSLPDFERNLRYYAKIKAEIINTYQYEGVERVYDSLTEYINDYMALLNIKYWRFRK